MDDEDTISEILELSRLTTEPYVRGLRPTNIAPTPGDNSNRSFINRTDKKKSIQNEIASFQGQKSQITLSVLNLDKS